MTNIHGSLSRTSKKKTLNSTKKEDNIEDKVNLSSINKRFENNINNVKELNEIKKYFEIEEKLKENIDFNKYEKNIYRSQIIFLISTLDFYIHEIVLYGMYKMYKTEWKITRGRKGYESKEVNIKYLHEIIENFSSEKEIDNSFINALEDSIKNYSYMKYYVIEEKFNELLGINVEGFSKKYKTKEKETKEFLNKLIKRRNQIAHQSDREKPYEDMEDIDEDYVKTSIEKIIEIKENINIAINEKNQNEYK